MDTVERMKYHSPMMCKRMIGQFIGRRFYYEQRNARRPYGAPVFDATQIICGIVAKRDGFRLYEGLNGELYP